MPVILSSRKIFVGLSLIVTGFVLQLIIRFSIASVPADATAGSMSDSKIDLLHQQMMIAFAGYGVSYVLILCGMILSMIGAYQKLKAQSSSSSSIKP